MAGKSIGNLHATVTANAVQFVSELGRAENAARRSGGGIDQSLTRLQRGIARKFTAGEIGKQFLGGVGLGSGFAVASTAAEGLTTLFREAAESAQEVEKSLAAQLDSLQKMLTLRRSEQQNLVELQKQQARLQREAEAAAAARAARPGFGAAALTGWMAGNLRGGPLGGVVGAGSALFNRFFGGLEQDKTAAAAAAQVQAAAAAVAELEDKMQDGARAAREREAAAAYRRLAQEQDRLLDKADRVFAATRTNAEKFNSEMRGLDELFQKHMIDADTFFRAQRDLERQFFGDSTKPGRPEVDALQRIGLSLGGGGRTSEGEPRKQTGLLTQIRDLLRKSTTARPAAGGFYQYGPVLF